MRKSKGGQKEQKKKKKKERTGTLKEVIYSYTKKNDLSLDVDTEAVEAF